MKIAICGSIEFVREMKEAANLLITQGHQVELPLTAQRILKGEVTLQEFKREKQKNGDAAFRKIRDDVIKRYYNIIKNTDAILVINLSKNNIQNYIGGNTFLEMGFAHVLNKRLYLFNDIPKLPYTDEIMAMQPVVLNGQLSRI